MSNLLMFLGQTVVGFSSIVMLCYTFVALFHCDKNTPFLIRSRLAIYLTVAAGTLLQYQQGIEIGWMYSAIVIATTMHMVFDRRKNLTPPQYDPIKR